MRSGISRVDLQPDHGAESPPPHGFLDRFEKVVAFQFLNCHLGVARHAERVGFDDFQPREQSLQVGRDQLFQPNEGCRCFRTRMKNGHGHQLRKRVRYLDPGEAFHAMRVFHHYREIQAQVGDVRKRPPRIECQGVRTGKTVW